MYHLAWGFPDPPAPKRRFSVLCRLVGLRIQPRPGTLRRVRVGGSITETWEAAPVALRAYAVISIVVWPLLAIASGTANLLILVFWPITLVFNYFLLRGVRWLWWFIVATSPFYVLSVITDHPPWYTVVLYFVSLGLLLLPESRHYVLGRGDEAPVG